MLEKLNHDIAPALLPGEGEGFVATEWQPIFRSNGLESLQDFFALSGTALSKPGLGKRYRARVEIGPNLVFYKRYDGESWKSMLQRWYEDGHRGAISRREVDVANALKTIGIKTFQPLAWGWTHDRGVNQKSFIVMSQVPGSSVEHWLSKANLDWRKKLELVRDIAALARTLHANGWFHRDLYLCHIFIEERDGVFQLALVDLARMFQPRWRIRRWQIKDLAQLNYSAPAAEFSRTMRLRFAKLYFGCDSLDLKQKALVRKIAARSEQIRCRDLAKQLKKNHK